MQFYGIIFPRLTCCTISWELFSSEISLLCLPAGKLRRLSVTYPAGYFLLNTPRSSGERIERREEKQ